VSDAGAFNGIAAQEHHFTRESITFAQTGLDADAGSNSDGSQQAAVQAQFPVSISG